MKLSGIVIRNNIRIEFLFVKVLKNKNEICFCIKEIVVLLGAKLQ